MASKKTPKESRSKGASPAEVQRRIRQLEQELVRLVTDRTNLAQKLAQLRADAGQPIYDAAEEEEAVQRMTDANRGPLSNDCIRAIGRELISGGRRLVHPLRVAYLGPVYSYSHLAAVERFGHGAELIPVSTISAVFEEVKKGLANFGIVPIENSTDGRVADTLDMFAKIPLRISAEVQIRIHHNLMGKCARGDVLEVYSKPQALSQCRAWLAKHVPHARLVELASTAAAAKLAVDKPGAAAIASAEAAHAYGLNIIAENIEDNPTNATRFAVIGNETAKRTGNDKTALMFEVPNRPGALADAMAVFKKANLNLTWIESFPMPGTKNEYLFFVECVGHENDSRVAKAITGLQRKAVRLVPLGSYQKAKALE